MYQEAKFNVWGTRLQSFESKKESDIIVRPGAKIISALSTV